MILALIGPTASGKGSIGRALLEQHREQLKLSVSLTTRLPRPGETEGVEYCFVSAEEFKQRVEQGDFFEWELVHGNYYGTLQSSLDEVLAGKHDLLLDIDIKGALSFKRRFPTSTVVVFVVPPSAAELLDRLKKRGNISEAELQRRLVTAREEYRIFLECYAAGGLIDYFVVNDVLAESSARVNAIYRAEIFALERLKEDWVKGFCDI